MKKGNTENIKRDHKEKDLSRAVVVQDPGQDKDKDKKNQKMLNQKKNYSSSQRYINNILRIGLGA